MTQLTGAEQIALLRSRIDASGLTIGRFAREVLLRDPRTIQRWLAGDSPIPQIVLDWIENPTPHSWPKGVK